MCSWQVIITLNKTTIYPKITKIELSEQLKPFIVNLDSLNIIQLQVSISWIIFVLFSRLDPSRRPTSSQLLQHPYFTHDNFVDEFLPKIRQKIEEEFLTNPLLDKQLLYSDSYLERKGKALEA